MNIKLSENPDIVKSINAIYQFTVSKGDAVKVYSKFIYSEFKILFFWNLKIKNDIVADLKNGKIITSNSDNIKADCMITIKDDDFVGLASGTAKPQQV